MAPALIARRRTHSWTSASVSPTPPRRSRSSWPTGPVADAVVHQIEQALSGRKRAVARPTVAVGGSASRRDRVAYVELNTGSEDRRVGFGAAVR